MAASKCSPLDIDGFVPSWSCHACFEKEGCATMNGNQRNECKYCGHERCDLPKVKRVAFETDEGMVIVPIRTDAKVQN